MRTYAVIACGALVLSSCAGAANDAQPYDEAELSQIAESTRVKFGSPAIGILIQLGDDEPIIAVSGVRKLGDDTKATRSDIWHVGSASKSMTAALLATYVDEGAVSFETTLEEMFPEFGELFTEQTKAITVEQLLNHRSGLAANPAETEGEFAALASDGDTLTEQRTKIVRKVISGDLVFSPGSDFSYSNTGYIVAAAVIEKLGGRDFETLLAERVFAPLGSTNSDSANRVRAMAAR